MDYENPRKIIRPPREVLVGLPRWDPVQDQIPRLRRGGLLST